MSNNGKALVTRQGNGDLLARVEDILERREAVDTLRLPPRQRLDQLETLIRSLMGLSATLTEQALSLAFVIKQEGVWREAVDPNGQKYTRFDLYFQEFWSELVAKVSQRTGNQMVMLMQTMVEANISILDAAATTLRLPSVAGEILEKVKIKPLGGVRITDPALRERMAETVGLGGEDAEPLDDNQVVREFMSALGDMEHGEAQAVVQAVVQSWSFYWSWNRKDKVLTMQWFRRGNTTRKDRPNLLFQLLGGDMEHPEIRKWLDKQLGK
jgi:hypothetical protein